MTCSAATARLAHFLLAALIGASAAHATKRDAAPADLAQAIAPELSGGLIVNGSQVLLVWGSHGTILRSEDGVDWIRAQTPGIADLSRVSANESGSVLVAVGMGGTLLRSRDAGRTWTAARSAETADLRAVVNQGKTWVAAGANGRILRSTDDARHWTPIESGLGAAFHTLFVDPQTRTILIGGDQGLIGFSKDLGITWQITALAMPDPVTPVTAFHRFGKLLVATSALGRFLISEDDAASWDLMQASTQSSFTDCAFDPRNHTIVMTGHNGDVLRSADGGRTWEGSEVTFDGRKSSLSATRFVERSGSLLAAGQGGTFARSTDGGATWSNASVDGAGDVRGLIDDVTRGRLIAFGASGMILISVDSGAHWSAARLAADGQRARR